jgi:enoyl-CoA hydratase/carnithine racemase
MAGDIRFERQGRLGVVILDRQRQLNALTHAMVRDLSARLAEWREDDGIGAVLVKPAPGRAFCAGGDIVAATGLVREGGVAAAVPFFRDEYRLNWRIHTYPKPYVALLDGITMGGGVGISVHGDFRVATERTQFAMPETGIGFFPDVGGTWFLPRCPGGVGMYLGLTGARLSGADCVEAGAATHAVPADRLAAVERDLIACAAAADPYAAIAECLAAREHAIGERRLGALRPAIDDCFAGDSLADLRARLADEPGGFGARQLEELGRKSPFALALTFAQLRRGRGLGIEDALRLEYRMVHRVLAAPDFGEGVRALLIDKDARPRWRHDRVEQVPAAEVAAFMEPLPEGDLRFDWHGI